MKFKQIVLSGMVIAFLLVTGSAFGDPLANYYGTNITIWDNRGVNYEDGETEPNMINSQEWDLEGFFLKGTTLTIIGGFDFLNGCQGYPTYTIGDLFLDINGDAVYGQSGPDGIPANFAGYDYVLDLNVAATGGTYDVIKLVSGATVLADVLENYNSPESSPWKYVSGGDVLDEDLALAYGLTDEDTGLLGGTHYLLSLDLADLDFLAGQEFTAHITMGCGNDNLMGKGTAPVPEPATMLLLGAGLVGLATAGRKRICKA